MHCPQCGQQQVSDITRFCSRCGFPMEGTAQLLASGGMLAAYPLGEESTEPSAKWRGVRQGMILFLIGVLLVPIMGVFSAFTGGGLSDAFQMLAALFALLCFVGGPVRMLYAALFEQGAPSRPALRSSPQTYVAPPSNAFQVSPARTNVLPPAAAGPTGGWRRPNTAELVDRPSVTENTTRLLARNAEQDPDQ
jgi:hypothetical protein